MKNILIYGIAKCSEFPSESFSFDEFIPWKFPLRALEATESVTVVLENMSGQGNTLGGDFRYGSSSRVELRQLANQSIC